MSLFGFTERNHKKQVYSKDEVDNLLPDMTDYYNKEETDTAIENAVEEASSDFITQSELDNKISFVYYTKSGINMSLTPGTHMITYDAVAQTIPAGGSLELFYLIPEGYRGSDNCSSFPGWLVPVDDQNDRINVYIANIENTSDNYFVITVCNPSSSSVVLDPQLTEMLLIIVKDPNYQIIIPSYS